MGKNPRVERPRPRFYEDGKDPWHIELVPPTLGNSGERHPAWRCGIFVVHGIGSQTRAEIAAALRSGFDDAWSAIVEENAPPESQPDLPPPYVRDGWWANYEDVEKTFPDDWKLFEDDQKIFFRNLWKQRTENALGTMRWFLKQQFRLLSWRTFRELGPLTYVLYLFLQIVSSSILLGLYIRRRDLVNGFLADIRMYADPRGVTERAIVQRIDARVADAFLQMIGLDREFRELPDKLCIRASGQPLRFDRVVWVAHSLGSVISYNVLSDLFHRAAIVERDGDEKQRAGVELFRNRLRRFVTLGSPLDKFAFLFKSAVRPWPKLPRWKLLKGGDRVKGRKHPEWWINYYHALDPVSGALGHPHIKGGEHQFANPVNIHLRGPLKIPGAAHVAYWHDVDVLRFILGRTYGARYLPDRDLAKQNPLMLRFYSIFGLVVWAFLIIGSVYGIVFHGIPFLLGKGMAYLKG